MKNLLLAVSLCVVSGCSIVEVEHTHGELPEFNVPAIKGLCNHKAKIKEEHGGLVVVCEMKL